MSSNLANKQCCYVNISEINRIESTSYYCLITRGIPRYIGLYQGLLDDSTRGMNKYVQVGQRSSIERRKLQIDRRQDIAAVGDNKRSLMLGSVIPQFTLPNVS